MNNDEYVGGELLDEALGLANKSALGNVKWVVFVAALAVADGCAYCLVAGMLILLSLSRSTHSSTLKPLITTRVVLVCLRH